MKKTLGSEAPEMARADRNRPPESSGRSRWVEKILIPLLAAGSGLLAYKQLIRPEPAPPAASPPTILPIVQLPSADPVVTKKLKDLEKEYPPNEKP